MLQDILTISIILFALAFTIFSVKKSLNAKKKGACGGGGCSCGTKSIADIKAAKSK